MSNKPTEQELATAVRDLADIQKRSLQIKEQELQLENEKVKSNEKIALATIDAQKQDRKEQMTLFSKVYKTKYIVIGVICFFVTAFLIYSVYAGQTNLAEEFIKIAGAVLLGYFAGVNKGKASTLEKQHRQDDE